MSRARDVAKLGGFTQVVPSSVTVGSGTSTINSNGKITISGASNVVINGSANPVLTAEDGTC